MASSPLKPSAIWKSTFIAPLDPPPPPPPPPPPKESATAMPPAPPGRPEGAHGRGNAFPWPVLAGVRYQYDFVIQDEPLRTVDSRPGRQGTATPRNVTNEAASPSSPSSRCIFFPSFSISVRPLLRQPGRVLLFRILAVTFFIALSFRLRDLVSLCLCSSTSASRRDNLFRPSPSRRLRHRALWVFGESWCGHDT